MNITNELLMAYAEGNVSESERQAVLQYLTDHPDELESMMALMDEDFDIQLENSDRASSRSLNDEIDVLLDEIDSEEPETNTPTILPLMQKAAQNVVDNLCAVRCEGYALRALGLDVSDKELEAEAEEKGFLKSDGMPLYCIGLLSEKYGLFAARRYDCSTDDLIRAVTNGEIVIATIDCTELKQSIEEANRNDLENGKTPNHAVIVQAIDLNKDTITLLDPAVPILSQTYPIDIFQNAWNDSSNYIVVLSNQSNYEPHPLNLDDVYIEPELLELREAIAENAHEVWAKTRIDQGWTYGPERDDTKKLHPDLLPYNLLPESEKEFDRKMAINTIKLVKKLGWDLKKKK